MSILNSTLDRQQLAFFRSGQSQPLLVQNAEANKRPFIHPISAPQGMGELTENQPGHHLWQHGLYVGLNQVNGFGFWTEGLRKDPLDGTFHPQPLSTPCIDGHSATWEVETSYRTPQGEPLLTETQKWRLEDLGSVLLLDIRWTMGAERDLKFGKYAYGGLFLRMPWRQETHGEILTSEGATTHQEAEAKRARWIAIAMPIPGRMNGPAGFAFFDHPSNPEFPNPWRVDGNLGIAPSRCITGGWTLPAGEKSSNRYRLVAFTGPIQHDDVESRWRDFAVTEQQLSQSTSK